MTKTSKNSSKPAASISAGAAVEATNEMKTWSSLSELVEDVNNIKKATAKDWLEEHDFSIPNQTVLKMAVPDLKSWIVGQAAFQERILEGTGADNAVSTMAGIAQTLTGMREEFKSSHMVHQSTTKQLADSLEFAHGEIKDLKTAIADIQKGQKEAANQATILAVQEAEPATVVLLGIAETSDSETEDCITKLFAQELKIEEPPRIVSVSRLGRVRTEEDAKPRKVIVELQSSKAVNMVMRHARNMGDYNTAAKAAGTLPIGITRGLSRSQLRYKHSLDSTWEAARAAGKHTQWRGHRLYVNQIEVVPSGTSS